MEPQNAQSELEQQKIEAGRAAFHGALEEEIDNAFEEIKNPIERAPAKIAELKEVQDYVSREQKIDRSTQQFQSRILLDLIHLHPNPGKTTPAESYLQVIRGRYEELVADLREKFKDSPEMNPEGIAFQISMRAIGELHRSASLETAKAIFSEEHTSTESDESEPARISQTNIISSPFTSETSFKAAKPINTESIHTSAQGPSMFRLEDLQQTQIQQTPPKTKERS